MLLTALKTGRTSHGCAAFLHSEFTSVWEKGERRERRGGGYLGQAGEK